MPSPSLIKELNQAIRSLTKEVKLLIIQQDLEDLTLAVKKLIKKDQKKVKVKTQTRHPISNKIPTSDTDTLSSSVKYTEKLEEVKKDMITPLEKVTPIDHYPLENNNLHHDPIDKLPNRNPNDLDLVLNISRSNILYEDKFLLQKDLHYVEPTVKQDLCTHNTDPPIYTKPHIIHFCIYTSLLNFMYTIYTGLYTHILCRQTKIKEKYANSGPKAKQRDMLNIPVLPPVIPVPTLSNITHYTWNHYEALSLAATTDIMMLLYYTQDNTSWYDDTIFYISEKEPD